LGFDPDSKLIKSVRKEILKTQKSKVRTEQTQKNEDTLDGYQTPDDENYDQELIDGNGAKKTDGEMVYEQLSDAFGFKKRYFSDDLTKSEHKWNRYIKFDFD